MEEYVPLKDDLSLLIKKYDKRYKAEENGVLVFPFSVHEEQTDSFLTQQIISHAVSMRLDIYRTLILVLKGMWEKTLEEKKKKKDSLDLMDEYENEITGIYNISFKPDCSGVHDLIQKSYHKRIRSSESLEDIDRCHYGDFDKKALDHLIQEMLLNKIYFYSIDSKEVEVFIEKKTDEYILLKQVPEKKQQKYWLARCVWIELQEELSELLMLLESSRLQNGYIVREFLRVFGSWYVTLKEQIIRVFSLKRRLILKDTHPEWTKDDVEEKAKKIKEDEEEEIEKLKFNAKMAYFVDDIQPGRPIDEQALNEYKKKVKKVLREIYFLLHPHRLMHNPQFRKLTEKQRKHLMKLWDRVMEIKHHELRYPEGTVGHYMHSLDKLLSLRDKAHTILSHSGLTMNVNYIIHGDTIDDRLVWLNNEIKQLEKDIQSTRDEILTLQNNKDILEKKAALACPTRHEQVKEEMCKRADELRKEADELKATYEHLFKGN